MTETPLQTSYNLAAKALSHLNEQWQSVADDFDEQERVKVDREIEACLDSFDELAGIFGTEAGNG